ncbi:MAG: glycosyltransferase family 4 protein [Oscillospiraceae bacterium]|nr:glycosyltransferase family 4 protein [Oscillospiraceae bacterium]
MELTDRLINNGYNVTLCFPLENEDNPFKNCNIINIHIDRRGMNPFKDLKLFFKYLSILRKVKPDVVLTYTIKPNLYGGLACVLQKVPFMPNITGLGSSFHKRGIVQKLIIAFSKFVFRKAATVFVQNDDILKYLREINAVSDNVVRIPGSGVNLEKYVLLEYPKEDTPIVFNFVARIMKEKGIDEYLEAARRIKNNSRFKNVVFNVIGSTEESIYDDILKTEHEKGTICYRGYQPDMIPYLRGCHCTVNPTYHEGMSNVLQESSACGRPVIASDIPGCKEIVDDGVTGFLCKVKDADDLSLKIEKFIMLPYKEKVSMGLLAREKMQREFDRNIVIDSYMRETKKIQGDENGKPL